VPGEVVTEGALLMCPMGTVPCELNVIPEGAEVGAPAPVATIMTMIPELNIMGFDICHSPGNPACLNPTGQGPCVPAIVDPWAPGAPNVLVNGVPALTMGSVCECAFGGVITIVEPGQFTVTAV
jgi:uncharacterized Zn-binding protein involved in type VI secretion